MPRYFHGPTWVKDDSHLPKGRHGVREIESALDKFRPGDQLDDCSTTGKCGPVLVRSVDMPDRIVYGDITNQANGGIMNFTAYGQTLAMSEPVPAAHPLGGATAHAHATAYDSGKEIVLTGKDANGKKIRMEAKSIYGAFMKAKAAWGIDRAWIIEDGKRRLLFSR